MPTTLDVKNKIMKKLGAWLIKTSHAIAKWWGKLTNKIKCNWNNIIFAISFKLKGCEKEKCICIK
tara:strand:- start:114 stop:308 length:195 start_codon:yes stop_codon:yes gene_type:complete